MDAILVTMPNNLREFLFALPVVQDYTLQLATAAERGEREKYYQITYRMDEKFSYFEAVIRMVKDNVPIFDYTGWPERQRGEFDCYIEFDMQRGIKTANNLGYHIVYGFNTLVGAGSYVHPILAAWQLPLPSVRFDVLVLSWDDNEDKKLYDFLVKNHPNLDIHYDDRNLLDYTVEELVTYLNCFNIVIGKSDAITFLAGSLKKSVIELFDTNEEAVLFNTAGNGKAHRAVISKQYFKASYLWKVWESLWDDYTQGMSNEPQQDQTVLHQSTADNAVEK